MPADSSLLWQVLVLGLLVGLGLGFVVAYALVLKNRRADSLRVRLQEQQERHDDYRRQVDAHFVQTSELFQDLTERHRSMYEHLAQGAQALCSDDLLAQRLAVVESRLRLEQRVPTSESAAGAGPGQVDALGVESASPAGRAPEAQIYAAEETPGVTEMERPQAAEANPEPEEESKPGQSAAPAQPPSGAPQPSRQPPAQAQTASVGSDASVAAESPGPGEKPTLH